MELLNESVYDEDFNQPDYEIFEAGKASVSERY